MADSDKRVALGRALVRDPEVFLLDEPLGNLDATLRDQVRYELKKIQRTFGITTIYVTHDQSEAMTLADRIVLIKRWKSDSRRYPPRFIFKTGQSLCSKFYWHTSNKYPPGFNKKREAMIM